MMGIQEEAYIKKGSWSCNVRRCRLEVWGLNPSAGKFSWSKSPILPPFLHCTQWRGESPDRMWTHNIFNMRCVLNHCAASLQRCTAMKCSDQNDSRSPSTAIERTWRSGWTRSTTCAGWSRRSSSRGWTTTRAPGRPKSPTSSASSSGNRWD